MSASPADEMRWWSATETAHAIRSGAVTSTEVLEASIARIEASNPELAAVVIPLFDRARGVKDRNNAPFAGVPMLLKDAGEELAGTPHWVGTQGLRQADHLSVATTELAQRFEELGFVIVGKSACPELSASSTTEPPGFAPTRNPWDRTRTVGGSSGGSAAAVAAGLVPIAHGCDATGSLRFPASHCGVVTLKPSRGRVPIVAPTGQRDGSEVWTQFALARDVRDLQALFPLVANVDDSMKVRAHTFRVGLLDHDPIVGLQVSPDCAAAVHRVGDALAALGHRVEINHPPALNTLFAPYWKAMKTIMPVVRAEQVA